MILVMHIYLLIEQQQPQAIDKKSYTQKLCFISWLNKWNNAQVDTKYTDVVIPMYSLIQCSDIYSKTSGILWQYYKDEPSLNHSSNFVDFVGADQNSNSFIFKQKTTCQTENNTTKYVEIIVWLKCL